MSYHINPESGEPGECSAEPGNCPFGGEHFETEAKARVAYEKSSIANVLSRLTKSSVSVPGLRVPNQKAMDEIDELAREVIQGLPGVELANTPTQPSEVEKLIALGEEIKQEIKDDKTPENATATGNGAAPASDDEEFKLPPVGESLDDVMKEVNDLVGMDEIKKHIKTTGNLLRIQAARKNAGLPVVEVGIHRAFVGGPGTGKTTMARFMGRVYKATGRLSKGHLVEVDREALVAGFVGQTAEKTKAILEKAKGGVLFIDEAYSLVPEGSGNDYGKEAIATVLKYMEDNRDDFSLIVAGYPKEMKSFLDSNSGLSSRFKDIVDFKDYGTEELDEIMTINLKKNQYTADDKVRGAMKAQIKELVDKKGENFGNARTLRSYFEEVVERQADRLSQITDMEELTKEKLQKFELADLPQDLRKLNH